MKIEDSNWKIELLFFIWRMKWWVISVGSVVCVVATGTYFYVKVQKNKISRESKEEEKSIEQVVEEKEFEKFQDVEEVVEKKCRNYEEYDDDEKIEFIAPPKIVCFFFFIIFHSIIVF
jgi:hypothetical protein